MTDQRIASTPKRTRSRLAKSEMWLAVAASHAVNDMGTPKADGGVPEFEQDLMDRYGRTSDG